MVLDADKIKAPGYGCNIVYGNKVKILGVQKE